MHVLVTLTLNFQVSYYSKGTKNTYGKGDYNKLI